MRHRSCPHFVLALVDAAVAVAPAPAGARIEQVPDQARGRPTLSVLAAPSPVLGTDRRRHLVYEIIATNRARLRVRFDCLGVVDAATGRTLAAYRGRGIASRMVAFPTAGPARTLLPRREGALLLDLAFARARRIPSRLVHRFVLSVQDGGGRARRVAIAGAVTRVDLRAPIRIGSPLRGERLLDGNGCCAGSDHIRAVNLINGRLFQAQRFAIDFVGVNPQGTNTSLATRLATRATCCSAPRCSR
jgi:hypothetical protein